LPQSSATAVAGLFRLNFVFEGEELPLFYFYECRPMNGAVLVVQADLNEDDYESTRPVLEELLEGITVEPLTSASDSSRGSDASSEEVSSSSEKVTISGSGNKVSKKQVRVEAGRYLLEMTASSRSDEFQVAVDIDGAGYDGPPLNFVAFPVPGSSGSDDSTWEQEVEFRSAGNVTIRVDPNASVKWTLTLTPLDSQGQDQSGGGSSDGRSNAGGQDTIRITGGNGASPSKRVNLEAGQYGVKVTGNAPDGFGGLFSVTIEGPGYYELPINDVIDGSGPYSSSSDVYIEASGAATISVTSLGLDDWTLTLTPVGSSAGGSDDGSGSGSSSGSQDTILITGTNGSSPSKQVNLEAGQYRVDVSGNAPEGFGGLFSVTIEGSNYYELPINEVIQGSGPYSATSEVYIDSSGSATISVTTLGLDDWTLTLTLMEPA